ncbi:MAG: amino acid ABC transporter substrate-binding protein [Rhizobiales bacterium]|nr:amino acid ABC transporter substrate-binding protein [Hyphomicrobiales bacterium]
MTVPTVTPGVLCVGSAIPDPPFELMRDGVPTGLDIELMKAIAGELGLAWKPCRYTGADFEGIYDGLDQGAWDCVASGATITPAREAKADFCTPYLVSGQSLVCNVERTPDLHSIDDLKGRVVAVQRRNTSEPVIERLKAQGMVGDVRLYPYDGIVAMLDDLEAGKIAAIMKLAPVMHWLTRDRPHLRVVEEEITVERIAVSVRRGNDALRQAIEGAQQNLVAKGTLARLVRIWVGT